MGGLQHFFKPYPIDIPSISVHGVGIQEEMRPGMVNRPYGTGDYLLMYFYQACVVRDAEDEVLRPPGTFIVWKPANAHVYGNPHLRWTHSWLHCDGFHIGNWLRKASVPVNRAVHPKGVAFEQYLEMLHRELTGPQTCDKIIVCNLMENMIRSIGRSLNQTETRPIPQWLMEIRHELEADFASSLNLKSLTKKSHRSIPHICEQFKRHFGTPVIEYVIRMRLQRAAYLLANHNLNIGEIGRLVGYEDIYHFSKLFKKHYGVSPRTYRTGGANGRSE